MIRINKVIKKINNLSLLEITLLLFLVVFLVSSFATTRYSKKSYTKGDEPHYLLVTQSLIQDRDLDLRNNYENRHYSKYYPSRIADDDWHVSSNSQNGKLYPAHSLGVSLTSLPFFLWGGRDAVLFLTSFLSALSAIVTFLLITKVIKLENFYSAFLSIGMALTLPFLAYSYQIFPAMFATFIIVTGYYFLSSGRNFLSGVVLALLPWFHFKYILVLGVLFFWRVFLITKKRTNLNKVLLFVLPILLFLVLLLFYTKILYGSLLPSSGLVGHNFQSILNLYPIGLFGLLLDRAYGLLPFSPYYGLLFAGIFLAIKKGYKMTFLNLGIILALLIPHFFVVFWHGQWSPPGRYLVEALPFFTLFLGVVLRERKKIALPMYLIGLAVSLLISVTVVIKPQLLYSPYPSIQNHVWKEFAINSEFFPSIIRGSIADFSILTIIIGILLLINLFIIKRNSVK